MVGRQKLVENFALTLERERLALGYSQQQMAVALDMSLSSYKRIINNETNKIDLYTLYLLSQLTGKQGEELCGILTPLQRARSAMGDLSQPQLKFVSAVIQFELQFSKTLRSGEMTDDFVTLMIPTGNMQDGMQFDSCILKKVNVSTYRGRYGEAIDCAIQITSNHLHPTYVRNDVLLVSRTPIRDGDTGVFINTATGLAYIRIFHKSSICLLEPVSSSGHTFTIDPGNRADMDRWIKFGRVITKMRSDPDIRTVCDTYDEID